MDFSSTPPSTPLGRFIHKINDNMFGTQEELLMEIAATILEELAALGMDPKDPYILNRRGGGATLFEGMAAPAPLSGKDAKSNWHVDQWKKSKMRRTVQREAVARGRARFLSAGGDTLSAAASARPQPPAAAPQPQLPAGERKSPCSVCGTLTKNKDLRYHKEGARLAPYAWTHGVTYEWKWSCCNFVEHLTESTVKRVGCYHPRGCQYGKCAACRQPCPC